MVEKQKVEEKKAEKKTDGIEWTQFNLNLKCF